MNLVRLLDCHGTFAEQHAFYLEQNHTYHVEITFDEEAIQMYIDEALLFETLDWSFTGDNGRIGLKAGTGSVFPTTVAFDNVKVTLFDSSLGVPLIKQSDPRWSGAEYDTASRWSDQTSIGRWGCALTSMVMILHYYGITSLADGTALTPLTLNYWLNSQPDGYIGEGILNWLAVTRLTYALSPLLQTPKLEFSIAKDDVFSKVVNEIHSNRPAILQIDGHFLVADGVNQLGDDLLIKDPAYSFNRFSEHQTEIESARLFHPSQTDLSYIMIAHQPELNVLLTTEIGETPPELVSILDSLKPPDPSLESSPALTQLLLPKPVADTYTLSISQDFLAPFAIDVFVYDQQGQPTRFEVTGLVGPQPKTYSLGYLVAQKPTFTPTLTWLQFRQDLYLIKQSGGFWGWPIFWLLEWTVFQAEEKQLPYDPKILRVIALQLSSYRPWMTETSYRYLAQQLNSLGP